MGDRSARPVVAALDEVGDQRERGGVPARRGSGRDSGRDSGKGTGKDASVAVLATAALDGGDGLDGRS